MMPTKNKLIHFTLPLLIAAALFPQAFAPEAPKVFENNWLATVPSKSWFVALRLYVPLDPWIKKEWRPSEIELVK